MGYGYGPGWGMIGGWDVYGGFGFGLLHLIIWIAILIAIVAFVVWAVRAVAAPAMHYAQPRRSLGSRRWSWKSATPRARLTGTNICRRRRTSAASSLNGESCAVNSPTMGRRQADAAIAT